MRTPQKERSKSAYQVSFPNFCYYPFPQLWIMPQALQWPITHLVSPHQFLKWQRSVHWLLAYKGIGTTHQLLYKDWCKERQIYDSWLNYNRKWYNTEKYNSWTQSTNGKLNNIFLLESSSNKLTYRLVLTGLCSLWFVLDVDESIM